MFTDHDVKQVIEMWYIDDDLIWQTSTDLGKNWVFHVRFFLTENIEHMLVSTAFFNMIFKIIWTILGKKIVLEQGWKKTWFSKREGIGTLT